MEYNIENEEGILIQGKGNYCSKLKKGQLKTKTLLKITIFGKQEHSVQSADNQSRASKRKLGLFVLGVTKLSY